MVNPNNSINPTDPKINPLTKADSPLKSRRETNSRKNFKDILSETTAEDIQDSTVAESDPDGGKKSSLMDLFGQTASAKTKEDLSRGEGVKSSFLQGSGSLNLPTGIAPTLENDEVEETSAFVETNESNLKNSLKAEEKKGNAAAQFEQTATPAITALPLQGELNPINLALSGKVEQVAPVKSPIEDIVVELIDKLTIIQTKGQTDTVVTINAPGVFKGAIIVISEFDSARGQLNLAFENLKNEAKTLLDSLPNRENLLQALSKEGYTVQGFITTTITEHKPIFTQGEPELGKSREEAEDGENPNRSKKKNQ